MCNPSIAPSTLSPGVELLCFNFHASVRFSDDRLLAPLVPPPSVPGRQDLPPTLSPQAPATSPPPPLPLPSPPPHGGRGPHLHWRLRLQRRLFSTSRSSTPRSWSASRELGRLGQSTQLHDVIDAALDLLHEEALEDITTERPAHLSPTLGEGQPVIAPGSVGLALTQGNAEFLVDRRAPAGRRPRSPAV